MAAFRPEAARCSITMLRQMFEAFLVQEEEEQEVQSPDSGGDRADHNYSSKASVVLWASQLPELQDGVDYEDKDEEGLWQACSMTDHLRRDHTCSSDNKCVNKGEAEGGDH